MKKALLTIAAFALVACAVFTAGSFADEEVSLPQAISAESACPATSCASGTCHGFDNVPEPDGAHLMTCPESGCASVECHAWDTLMSRYGQASDVSLNLWILFPTLIVVALVALVTHGSRRGVGNADARNDAERDG